MLNIFLDTQMFLYVQQMLNAYVKLVCKIHVCVKHVLYQTHVFRRSTCRPLFENEHQKKILNK